MSIWAVVPVKESAFAKQRLSEAFSEEQRRALFFAMVADVFATVSTSSVLEGFAVVTIDPVVQTMARSCGGLVIEGGASQGYNVAVKSGISNVVAQQGAAAILTLPMDVPLITDADIEAIVAEHQRRNAGFTLVPSNDSRGTNATLSSPPGCVEHQFGTHSFTAHLKAAHRAQVISAMVRLPNVGLDIDLPQDVAQLLRHMRNTWTHRVLARTEYQPAPVRRHGSTPMVVVR